MRRVTKVAEPDVLRDNYQVWTAAYLADRENSTKKYRYRHSDIKNALRQETADKCVYCESKVGHNTPGDVEHMTPSSIDPEEHFTWSNLTLACTECNRRKNNYFDAEKPFLNPYTDDVEDRVVHHGPVVSWKPGDQHAEITIRTLELNEWVRGTLIARKVEKIDELNNLVARLRSNDELIRELMRVKLTRMKGKEGEYSGMINAVCAAYGL